MKEAQKYWNSFRLPLVCFAALLVIVPAIYSFRDANGKSLTVTWSHGALSVSIPYHAARAGSGRLVIEILDPEDQILGRAEQTSTLPKVVEAGATTSRLRNPYPSMTSSGTGSAIASSTAETPARPSRKSNPSRRFCAARWCIFSVRSHTLPALRLPFVSSSPTQITTSLPGTAQYGSSC